MSGLRLSHIFSSVAPWHRRNSWGCSEVCHLYFYSFFIDLSLVSDIKHKKITSIYNIIQKWHWRCFPQQSKLVMEGFRSLKEGEPVEFTYKKSSKGLESLRVTGPGGGPCYGSERRPKGKVPLQKRKPKGDRWVESQCFYFFLTHFCVGC